MKKILLGLTIVSALTMQAQDAKSVKKALDAKDLAKAQTAAQAFVDKSPESAEAWFLKHKVYWTISSDETLAATMPTAINTGLEAISKYVKLDKKLEIMAKDNITNPTGAVEAYYQKFRNVGSAALDAGSSDATKFVVAYENLKKAIEVSKIYYDLGWIKSPMDTSMVFYTGYAAMKANNSDEAVKYFTMLSDADAKESNDFKIGYGWLANYWLNDKKDKEKGAAALAKGRKFYPEDEYLKGLENDQINSSGDYTTMLANDEAKVTSPNVVYQDYLQYIIHLYDYLYVDKKDATDKAEKIAKIDDMMAKALALKPNNNELNYIIGLHNVQKYAVIEEKLKPLKGKTTPADVVVKNKIKEEMTTQADVCIKHFDLATTILTAKGAKRTATETERLKSCLNQLIYFYNFKKDAVRQKRAEDDLKELGEVK